MSQSASVPPVKVAVISLVVLDITTPSELLSVMLITLKPAHSLVVHGVPVTLRVALLAVVMWLPVS